MGVSISKSISRQNAEINLAQIYKGTCDITCQNVEENISVDVINSVIDGGIIFNQSCSANGNCIFGSTMDATADVFFKATNSTNAKNAWSGWEMNPFNIDIAESKSRQNIKESISQSVTETCKVSSYNEMNNISVFTANSHIGGGIEFNQSGNATGKCVLDNTMSAAAYATGMAENTASSGKNKKGEKFSVVKLMIYAAIGIIVLIIAIVVGKLVTSSKSGSKTPAKASPGRASKSGVPNVHCPSGSLLMLDPSSHQYACVEAS